MNTLTFILGGARSGKTRHAQELAAQVGGDHGKVAYIATAQANDHEMRDRITRHAADRPDHWRTMEEPLDIASAIKTADGAAAIVVDCLTMLLTNHLLAQGDGLRGCDEERATRAVEDLLCSAREVPGEVIVVANEVGLGIVPEYPLGRVFRDVAGRANQQVAAAADRVVFMVAGLPMRIKG